MVCRSAAGFLSSTTNMSAFVWSICTNSRGRDGTERPGNRLGAFSDLGLAASSRTLLEVDVLEAGHDRSTMRNPQVGRDALLPDFADQFGDCWPVSGQEDCIDGGSDDLLPRVVQHAVTVRPAAFAIHQRHDRPTGAECPNETICGGFADAEFACEIENVADTPAVRSISAETDGWRLHAYALHPMPRRQSRRGRARS